jgi:hypothetical protein
MLFYAAHLFSLMAQFSSQEAEQMTRANVPFSLETVVPLPKELWNHGTNKNTGVEAD